MRKSDGNGRSGRARADAGVAPGPDPLSAPDPLQARLSPAEDRVTVAEWSRRIPPVRARIPEARYVS